MSYRCSVRIVPGLRHPEVETGRSPLANRPKELMNQPDTPWQARLLKVGFPIGLSASALSRAYNRRGGTEVKRPTPVRVIALILTALPSGYYRIQ